MTATVTASRTFTITNARHVTSKIASELDLWRIYYDGRPSEQEVTNFAEEAAILLAARYLKSVEYGFRRNGVTVFALKYVARSDGNLVADDSPGRVYADIDLSDADFYSYLEYSGSFFALPQDDQNRFKAQLPIQRSVGLTPQCGRGYWEQTRTYSSNGEGVLRHIFRPL